MRQNKHDFRVLFGDTDAAGIVFYPNFYRWMDMAAHEYFRAIGFPIRIQMVEKRIGWPIVEAKCSFKSPLFHDDEVSIITELEEIGEKSIRLSHRFYRGEAMVASGYEVRVCTIFKQNQKPAGTPVPDEIRQAMCTE